jgi:hypothetical protein
MADTVVKPRPGALDPKLASLLEDELHEQKGYVYCAVCSHVVSHVDHRIVVNGSHDHHFVNPHGFRFHVGCYAEALGCSVSGDPMAADTWFPGFRWQLAACEECRQHLGWFFVSSDANFFGLVVDRIQTD